MVTWPIYDSDVFTHSPSHTHTAGPFLISTTINKKPVYWKVNQEQSTLIGTEDIKAASLFYIISAGNKFYPSNFTIAYWGDNLRDRKVITAVSSQLTKLRPIAPKLPIFLNTNTSIFDSSNEPLLFEYTFTMKTAQYSIHSRIYDSCACFICLPEPASLEAWLEGDEFYIKHSLHALKSVYLALKLESACPEEQRSYYASTLSASAKGSTTAKNPSYTSTTFPSIGVKDKKNIGMLFRLHPYQYQEMYGERNPTKEVLDSLQPGAL